MSPTDPVPAAAGSTGAAWAWLILAGLLEIAWAIGLKQCESFTRLWPSVITIVLMILSFQFLAQAVRTLPLGTAYAVWTGIGSVGVAIIGIVYFREAATVARIGCIMLIVAGIVGLKLLTTTK